MSAPCVDSRPTHVLLYTLIPTNHTDVPIRRSPLVSLRNRARRLLELALWRLFRIWRGHYSTFEDASGTNRGDIAIRMGVKQELTWAFGEHNVIFTEVCWGQLATHLSITPKIDLVVIAGGGFLFADSNGALSDRFRADVKAIELITCPIVATSIGLNHLIETSDSLTFKFNEYDQVTLRRLLARLSAGSVRDFTTQDALRLSGFKSLPVIIDPAFLLNKDPLLPDPLPSHADVFELAIGINVAFHGPRTSELSRHFLPLITRALTRFSASTRCRYFYFVHSDSERGIADALRSAGITLEIVDGDVNELLSAYSRMDIHIGQMLHSAILAMSTGVPVLALAYDIKSRGFFEQFGLDKWCLDSTTLTENSLLAAISALVADRFDIVKTIALQSAKLRAEARAFYAEIPALTTGASHIPARP